MQEIRYLIFKYTSYYPSGGWNDFVSAHATLEDAMATFDSLKGTGDYVQLVDLKECDVIELD